MSDGLDRSLVGLLQSDLVKQLNVYVGVLAQKTDIYTCDYDIPSIRRKILVKRFVVL